MAQLSMDARRVVWAFALALGAAAALAWAGPSQAAGITVKRGTVQSFSATNNSLGVQFGADGTTIDVPLDPKAEIHLNDKPAEIDALKPGTVVILRINADGFATRIVGNTAPVHKPSTPIPAGPARRTAPPARGSKTARGSGSPRASKRTTARSIETPTREEPVARSPGGAAEWPGFLGAKRDNISRDTGLLENWPEEGPPLAWQASGLGEGYSSVSVAGGMLFTMGTIEGGEAVLAVDVETGKPLWSVPTGGGVFRDANGNGPRGTPTVDGGSVYALGAGGDLVAIDVKSHDVRWRKNVARDFAAPALRWGYAESVLIDGRRLICTPGGRDATLAALDKETGDVVWKCNVPGSPSAGYSSAIVTDAAGTRQYVNYLSRGVVGVAAGDGRLLWGNDATANTPANCTTPVAFDNYVFVTSAYGGGGALLQLSAAERDVQASLVYHSREMKNHHGGLVALDGYLYGADEQILTCFSLRNGRAAWRNRSVGKCSLTAADRKLYVRSENGPVALVDASSEGYRELGRFVPPKNGTAPTWPYPVVAGGRLFLRDQNDLLCYDLREKQPRRAESKSAVKGAESNGARPGPRIGVSRS